MDYREIMHLKPNTSFTVDVEDDGRLNRLTKITLQKEGIVAISSELLRDIDPHLMQSFGDGTYRIGGLKLSLIMPRPLWASMNNSELFYVTIEKPEGINV